MDITRKGQSRKELSELWEELIEFKKKCIRTTAAKKIQAHWRGYWKQKQKQKQKQKKRITWGTNERYWYCRESDHSEAVFYTYVSSTGKSITYNHVPWIVGEIKGPIPFETSEDITPFKLFSQAVISYWGEKRDDFWEKNQDALRILQHKETETFKGFFQECLDTLNKGRPFGILGGFCIKNNHIQDFENLYNGYIQSIDRQRRFSPFKLNPLAKEWIPPKRVLWISPIVYAEPIYEVTIVS